MFAKTVFMSFLALAAAQAPAPKVTDNAGGVTYTATFDGTKGHGITGFVSFLSQAGQASVVNVNLDNLPPQSPGGPFIYHIHQFSIPAGANCSAAGAHLDPQGRGEKPACDASSPASCQVGDLAGKYGKMTTSPWVQTYNDDYISFTPGSAAFFGNRSIVIHDLNTTRIACANLEMVAAPVAVNGTATNGTTITNGTTTAPYPTDSAATTLGSVATATPVQPSASATVTAANSAAGKSVATGAMLLAAVAFLL